MYIKSTTAVLNNDSIMETVSLTEQPLLTSCFKICVFHVIINNSRSETDGCTWGCRKCSLAWRKQEVQRLNSGHTQHLDYKSNLDLYGGKNWNVQHKSQRFSGDCELMLEAGADLHTPPLLFKPKLFWLFHSAQVHAPRRVFW